MPIDFIVTNDGSIFLFRPLTEAARDWITENVARDANGYVRYFGPHLVVEHHYAEDLANGMLADGLTLQ